MRSDTPHDQGSVTDPERWQRLKSILADALEQESAAAMTAFVERSCAGDVDLLREAETLLAEAEAVLRGADDPLEMCADHAGTRIPRENVSEIGKRVGAYVITREIGQGGMGTVYLAARADGYFEKQVAIKLLSRGADTEEVLRRFRSEREVLARLDHPNIARLLDAGTTTEGVPYFVMEYIDGMPITHFIEATNASIEARLHLFLKVCGAVEFAHQNSIVHRDLKPSNILVNRAGEPKLLDFGIAKLLRNEGDPLELTAPGQERLSPIAASPEQARGAAVTKSSDVYALGALLYEMLTDLRPHRFPSRDPSRSELVSVLSEQEPIVPSLAVKEHGRKRQIQGDLDAIVLKALQKDPEHRYPSVRLLGEDVRRYLASEPVSARKSRFFPQLYRSRQFQFTGVAVLIVGAVMVAMNWNSLSGVWSRARSKKQDSSSTQTNGALTVPEKSIAVLPFDSFTGDNEKSYFVDGVQDNILTDLAKVSDLRVIGRTSVASYRNIKKNPREIGEALQVSHVLEGSIQRSDDRIRLNVRLIDTRTETEIWGEHYDRTIDDLFALQSELAETIVSRLKATLLPDEKAAIENRPTKDMVAYDLYLRAREEFYQYNYLQAIEFLDNAVARDPKFAIAYALLAEMNLYQYRFVSTKDSKRLAAAKIAADKAIALAPDLSESHLAQAQYYYYGTREFESALRELKLATSATNKARFLDLTALVQRRLGHWKEAIRNGEQAAELDPRNPFIVNELIESYLSVRRFEDAEALASKAIRLLPPTNNARWLLKAESFVGRGRLEEARAAVAEAPLARAPKVRSLLRMDIFARDYERAAQDLETMPGASRETPSTILLEATIAKGRGNLDRARALFQTAHDRLSENLASEPNDPGLLSELSWADLGLGRNTEALQEALKATELVPTSREAADGVAYATMLAMVYAEIGDNDSALEILAKIERLPNSPNYGELRFDPGWDKLRTNPKFEEIVQQSTQPLVYE